MINKMIARPKTLPLFMIALAACVALCVALPSTALANNLTAGSGQPMDTQGTQNLEPQAKVHKIRTAAQWRDISKYNGGTFKIMKNIKLPDESYYLNIRKNKKYTINLNGFKVKTAYTGVPLRTVAPLNVAGGTVTLTNNKNKGMLYSSETAAVVLQGYAKFYLKNKACIVNNATEFRSDITSGIMAFGKSKFYLQGKTKIQSIGNGIALFEQSRLSVTGNPWVRAGANEYTGQFMHYGCGINIASKDARIKLKGGSYGTKASPDATVYSPAVTMTYAQSANYPILDQFGFAMDTAIAKGYKVVDAKRQTLEPRKANLTDYYNGVTAPSWEDLLEQFGMKPEQRYTTDVIDSAGYYAVYVVKK